MVRVISLCLLFLLSALPYLPNPNGNTGFCSSGNFHMQIDVYGSSTTPVFWMRSNTRVLHCLPFPGHVFGNQSRLALAETMYRRALDGYEKAWGPEHTSTLDAVNNLNNLYADQGRLAETETINLQALTSSRKLRGSSHPMTESIIRKSSSILKV